MSLPVIRFWSLAAAISVLVVNSMAYPQDRTKSEVAQLSEWMHGVPHGFRLISFDSPDTGSSAIGRGDRVELMCDYVVSEARCESTALFSAVDILEANRIRQAKRAILRVTLAVTPHQADRLRFAAACGTLWMTAPERTRSDASDGPSRWDIIGITDRTEMIEAKLAAGVTSDSLERPTLATPAGDSFGRVRGLIHVPLEIRVQR